MKNSKYEKKSKTKLIDSFRIQEIFQMLVESTSQTHLVRKADTAG